MNESQGVCSAATLSADASNNVRTYRSMSDSTCSSADYELSFVARLLGERQNAFLCYVQQDFIRDGFNLHGLREVPLFNEAIELILASGPILCQPNLQERVVETAQLLYGLIHARYILTPAGLEAMRLKYVKAVFGRCCRYTCHRSKLLPFGIDAEPNVEPVKLFCPCCKDIYNPTSAELALKCTIDGAYFGRTFTQYFVLMYPSLITNPGARFQPTIFGFKLHSSSPFWKASELRFESSEEETESKEAYWTSQDQKTTSAETLLERPMYGQQETGPGFYVFETDRSTRSLSDMV